MWQPDTQGSFSFGFTGVLLLKIYFFSLQSSDNSFSSGIARGSSDAAEPNGEKLFLACSRAKTNPGAIARAYRARWRVEIFHKDVKSHLGFEDAGLMKFEAMHAHVLWVYCAYLLLYEVVDGQSLGILARRRKVERRIKNEEIGRILKANARFDSANAVRSHCLQVRQDLRVA